MPGLSSELYRGLRLTLLKCNEFDNHDTLLDVFVVDDLALYRDGLPVVENRATRVDRTLAYLMDKQLSDGRLVLPLFIDTLRKRRSQGDALYDELDERYHQVEGAMSIIEIVVIPFVIVAMNHTEAIELITETVFNDPEDITLFRQLIEDLKEHGIDDLASQYGECRDEWNPPTYKNTIDKIVLDIVNQINQQYRKKPLINPQIFSSNFFEKNKSKQSELWQQLKQSGCVLIVDAVSLFHPKLRRVLARFVMNREDCVAMLLLSPIDFVTIRANQLIRQKIASDEDMTQILTRFDEPLDMLCKFKIGGLQTLQVWLNVILPEVVDIAHRQILVTNRKSLRLRMGNPTGTADLIFWQRGPV